MKRPAFPYKLVRQYNIQMIYFLYGKDTIRSRKKLHELMDFAKKKRPDSELFKINSESWSETVFEELLVSQGLFDQKYTVVVDNVFDKKDIKNFIIDRLSLMTDSEQLFLMIETSIDAPSLKKIEKFVAEKYGAKKVVLDNKIDEKIKGGIIIKVGSRIIDLSLSGSLSKLSNTLYEID